MGNKNSIKNKNISIQNINNNNSNNNINNYVLQKYEIVNNEFQKQKPERLATIFQWDGEGKNVYLTGSFCDWNQFFEMEKNEDENNNKNNKFFLTLFLPKGIYQYKFKIDDQWKCNSKFPTCNDKNGNINNIIDLTKEKGEEVTEFSTSYVTTIPDPKMDETKFSNNTQILENEYNDNTNIKSEINNKSLDSFFEYNLKYDFNLDLLLIHKNEDYNQFLGPKEQNILNDNYSYKKIIPLKHEQVEHFIFNKNNNINNSKSIISSSSFRYRFKLTTVVYYKPKLKPNNERKCN